MAKSSMEDGLYKIMRGAGVIIALMGVLIIWRGVTKMIPVTGILHGGIFTLGGLFFFVFGAAMLMHPTLSARRKAKKAREEARLREQITEELKEQK